MGDKELIFYGIFMRRNLHYNARIFEVLLDTLLCMDDVVKVPFSLLRIMSWTPIAGPSFPSERLKSYAAI